MKIAYFLDTQPAIPQQESFFEFRKNGQLQGQYTQGQNITILIYAVALDI